MDLGVQLLVYRNFSIFISYPFEEGLTEIGGFLKRGAYLI